MKIGAITVGQAPRVDVTADIFPIWDGKVELTEAGALDGMTFEEIGRLKPEPGDYVLVSRMTDGTQVTFAEKYLGELLQGCVDRLERQGVEMIVFFCTGEFPFTFRHRVPVVYPSELLNRIVPLIAGDELIVLTPSKLQLEQSERKWGKYVRSVKAIFASPYGDPAELEVAIAQVKELPGSLVVMDCIGYTRAMKAKVAAATGKRVVLSRTLVARIVDELADISDK